jgi:hypothetical protein
MPTHNTHKRIKHGKLPGNIPKQDWIQCQEKGVTLDRAIFVDGRWEIFYVKSRERQKGLIGILKVKERAVLKERTRREVKAQLASGES